MSSKNISFVEIETRSVYNPLIEKGPTMELQLKQLRKKKGYTNRDAFAKAMGIPPATYKSWETEARKIKLEDACRIADFLDCSLDELAGRWDYVGAYSDERQRRLNEAYAYLDDSQKDSAVGSVEGMASVQARKKAASEGPAAGERSA